MRAPVAGPAGRWGERVLTLESSGVTPETPPVDPADVARRPRLSEGVQVLIATVIALVVIGGGIFMYVANEHTSIPCTIRYVVGGPTLSTVHSNQVGPPTTLPPSRDNDAARSRILDATPDADNDVLRREMICP